MGEFYSSYRHLFEDETDPQYNSQLRGLNHIVEQSKRERVNSEKKRQIQKQKDLQIINQIMRSPDVFDRIHDDNFQRFNIYKKQISNNKKEFKDFKVNFNDYDGSNNLFNRNNDSILRMRFKEDEQKTCLIVLKQDLDEQERLDCWVITILRKQQWQLLYKVLIPILIKSWQLIGWKQEKNQKSPGFFGNKYQIRRDNDVLPLQNKNRSSSIEELLKIDYPNTVSSYTSQPQRKNQFFPRSESNQIGIYPGNPKYRSMKDDEQNIFKDPLEVPHLRQIMLGDGMKFQDYRLEKQNQEQRGNIRIGRQTREQDQLNYSPQNVGYSKKKKYLEYLGHNILNPMPQPSIEEISQNQRFNSYDSAEKKRKNKILDQNDKEIKQILQNSYVNSNDDKNLNRNFIKTPILDIEYNPNPLIYERIRSEMNYNKNIQNNTGIFVNGKDQDGIQNTKDNQPHQIEAIHKGFDKYQQYKRKQKDFSMTPDLLPQNNKTSPIARRLAASRQIQRKDRVADLLSHDYIN